MVVPSKISLLDLAPITDSLRRSGVLVVCDEGSATAGWAADVMARVSTDAFQLLRSAPQRVAAHDLPVAGSRRLATAILPHVEDIIAGVRSLVSQSRAKAL